MTNHQQDPEIMEDFFNDFSEAHLDSENILIDLEHDPSNRDLLNALFRSVHTIKGNLIYVGLKDLTPLIQSVEDLLDAIRKGHLEYDSLLSDLILISMDHTKQMVEARVQHGEVTFDDSAMDILCQTVTRVAESDSSQRGERIADALLLLDPSIDLRSQRAEEKLVSNPPPARAISIPPSDETGILDYFHVDQDDDLRFFRSLAAPLENRSLYWRGRTARILRLTLAMNMKAGKPIEPEQLAAAVYLHDIGMAFLPLEMLHKITPLNQDEREDLQAHPDIACQLLACGRRWEQAAQAVKQHHEKVDGSGYPEKLSKQQICDGAKILAIADAFEARTHERAYQTQLKRPLVRAVLEINRCSDTHFDPLWVNVFNEVVREIQPSARKKDPASQ